MAEGFQTEEDEQTLAAVLRLASDDQKGLTDAADRENGALPPAFEHYLSQLVRYATGEDRNWSEPETLLERGVEAWRASAVRKPGEHIIVLRAQDAEGWRSERLVLDIVTDDRPFLVDSISAMLSNAGKPVSFFANAVVDCSRNADGVRTPVNGAEASAVRESMIHAEMDPAISEAEVDNIRRQIELVLNDVAVAVDDWEQMRARLGACIAQLERTRPSGVDRDDQRETVAFLKWLWDNRFAFLGVRRFIYKKTGDKVEFTHDPTVDLGIMRDTDRRILKSTYTEDGRLSPAVEDFLQSGEPILVAKANAKSLVHRPVYMDYIGVKTYSVNGELTGEERFVGLFTAEAYNRPATDIPLLRAKVRKVIEEPSFAPGGHNEKALVNILETFPRDEMFQIDVETLAETSLGILRLYKRPRVKLFLRRDRFDRFVSALVFVPRDRFSSNLRESIGAYLAETFNGRVSAFYPSFGDASLVRVHFIIGLDPGAPEGPGLTEMTRRIRELCREWRDDLLEALRGDDKPVAGHAGADLFERYEKAFDAAYRERTPVSEALNDIAVIENLGVSGVDLRTYRRPGDADHELRIKLYAAHDAFKLSRVIPSIENLGLGINQEHNHEITLKADDGADRVCHIHDFYAEEPTGKAIDFDNIRTLLEDALKAVLSGVCEDDMFNALVVLSELNWREAWILRAAARHHMQAGFQFSQTYIAEALAKHPHITRDLIAVFHARFNPSGPSTQAARAKELEAAEDRVHAALEEVSSLDDDRIIRRYLTLFEATTRTNYYVTDADGRHRPFISFKIDSGKIAELPEPKPYREIFVSGPRVDGVHLRFGPVARGGLRWSDRREDFRTEVLGLVKAQRVKNAVIVPTGSKGGFYPKQLPVTDDRNAIFEAGRAAYQEFIRGLLDVTDNIVKSKITPPPQVVAWDDPDPYLVVAADKGTATFSDTANAISEDYGFWLGDAFASGGSAGYDHKVMGITARGAWEAVKRHFREIGKDIQSEEFTAAGVGDMSGDVFGNGMLLSEKTRLVAAFDHRDIFIDPAPDAESSYKERMRLFQASRSSWQDYDPALISKGGGVFSRGAKSITLSDEIRALLGVSAKRLAPSEVIKAILKTPVELFWLGGIGTYFKARDEEHWEVGDRNNDAVRIDAPEIGADVIGEGANLGLTQRARIEFARAGGRINTDAIDNSAGVDSSDHEVNIKILLSSAIEKGELKSDARNEFLSAMTEDVARHVLVHNYEQTRALSQMQSTAADDLDAHARLMNALEQSGRLDRAIENLPSLEDIQSLRSANKGLSRPELAVLLAYSKNWLFDELAASHAPDDPALERELFSYFPEAARTFNSAIIKHRLRREIIATRLANEIVDTCGASFPYRAVEATGVRFSDIALSYEAARRVLDLGAFAANIDALDNAIAADVQIDLYNAASVLLREQMYRIASGARTSAILEKRGVGGIEDEYGDAVALLKTALAEILPKRAAKALAKRAQDWIARGAPEHVAQAAALMPALELVFDVANLAKDTGWPVDKAGAVFFAVGDTLQIDQVRRAVAAAAYGDYYDKLAIRRMSEDLAIRQTALARSFILSAGEEPDGALATGEWLEPLCAAWKKTDEIGFKRYQRFIDELELKRGMSVAKLSLLNRKLFDLQDRLGV